MKRLLLLLGFAVLFAWSPRAHGQQLRWVWIDGTVTPPVLQTDLAAGERPTVTRMSAGGYRLEFRRDVRFFNGDAQRGGGSGDAASMLFTSRYDTANPRVFYITTYAIGTATPVSFTPMDSRMSIVIVRR
ncbi:MAG TPA: hypothetical protein VM733_15865 [Thermoanaerobaculia bacterium]|nr:hypothetical protein [Thermoanaerobaculia bacterium]